MSLFRYLTRNISLDYRDRNLDWNQEFLLHVTRRKYIFFLHVSHVYRIVKDGVEKTLSRTSLLTQLNTIHCRSMPSCHVRATTPK